jgi:hypothetical protein
VSAPAAGEVAARRQSFKPSALSIVDSQQANLGFHAKEKYSTGLKLLLPNTIYPNWILMIFLKFGAGLTFWSTSSLLTHLTNTIHHGEWLILSFLVLDP